MITVVYLKRGSRHPSFSGIEKSYGCTAAIDEARRYGLAMKIDTLLMIAGIEEAGVPALRVAFTLAVIMFLFGGVFIWRGRHQFFDPDPNVEDDVPVVRHDREEAIIFVWSGIILILISILYQVWSA
ncbi:MAG TPA: hypothetical protein VGM65_01710 [Candidatus Udaeobacter sp.]